MCHSMYLMIINLLFVTYFCSLQATAIMDEPIVQTSEGQLKGCVKQNLDGEEIYGFLGIPYIKPALGDLRFKAPQPPEPWTGIRDATKPGSPVYQRETFSKTLLGSEDGVNLNVYTKKPIPQEPKLNPVMVFIHGGGYTEGSNTPAYLGPEYLLLEDVVLVTINYRLGLLGYMAFEDPSLEVYGNAGSKDQVAALKWVQRNIRNFGGDPNKVTIFGQSAGGACVQSLMMSPSAKGLFHRAIMQSGTTASFWSQGTRLAKGLLTFLGKEHVSEKEALEYFTKLPVGELFQVLEKFCAKLPAKALGVLGPIVEVPNDTAFLTKHPFEYLLSGDYNKVPVMMGYNSLEAACLNSQPYEYERTNFIDNLDLENFLMMIAGIGKGSEASRNLVQKLKKVYAVENGGIDKYLLVGDFFFVMGVIGSAKHHVNTSDEPLYLYRMSLDAGLNLYKQLLQIKNLTGVSHGDDLGYLFKNDFLPAPKSCTVEDVSLRRFVKLWANFARYGNPTPEKSGLGIKWKPMKKQTTHFIDIGKKLTLQTDLETERVNVWREIFKMNPLTANIL